VPAVLLAVLVLAALPGVAAAKTIVYGVPDLQAAAVLVYRGLLHAASERQHPCSVRRRELVARHPGALPGTGIAGTQTGRTRSSACELRKPLRRPAGFSGLVDNGYYPSDAQVAAGPSDIVEMTNTMTAIYSRSGFTLAEFPDDEDPRDRK